MKNLASNFVQMNLDIDDHGRFIIEDTVNNIKSYWTTGDPMTVEVKYINDDNEEVTKRYQLDDIESIENAARQSGLPPIQVIYNSVLIKISEEENK